MGKFEVGEGMGTSAAKGFYNLISEGPSSAEEALKKSLLSTVVATVRLSLSPIILETLLQNLRLPVVQIQHRLPEQPVGP